MLPEDRTAAMVDRFWPMLETAQGILRTEPDGAKHLSGFVLLLLSQTLAQIEYDQQWNRDAVVTWLYTWFIPKVLESYDGFERAESP